MEGLTEGLHKKAQQALKQNLAEGEEVLAVVHGQSGWAMIGTDRRVFVFKKGISAGAMFGTKFTSFDYRNVGGVELKKGMMAGHAVLDVAGAPTLEHNKERMKAANAIALSRPYDSAETEIARLRKLITDWHDRDSASTSAPVTSTGAGSEEDIMAKIQQLGELRDRGLVTPEEFEAKKAELLGRL